MVRSTEATFASAAVAAASYLLFSQNSQPDGAPDINGTPETQVPLLEPSWNLRGPSGTFSNERE